MIFVLKISTTSRRRTRAIYWHIVAAFFFGAIFVSVFFFRCRRLLPLVALRQYNNNVA